MEKYYWNKDKYDDMAEHFPSFNVSRFKVYRMLEDYRQNHKDIYDRYYGYDYKSYLYDEDDEDDEAEYAYSHIYDEV